MDFSELKLDDEKAKAKWNELKPKIIEILQSMKEQILDDPNPSGVKWDLKDPCKPSRKYIHPSFPMPTKYCVGIENLGGLHIYVCLESNLASVRVYLRLLEMCFLHRNVYPWDYERVFKTVAQEVLEKLGNR